MKSPLASFPSRFVLLAAFTLVLVNCSSIEVPGSARYFSNQPGGAPFFKVASGVGGPSMAVQKDDGKWGRPHAMKPVGLQEPPLSTTPGLAALVKSAYRVDRFVFLEFRPDAKDHGRPLPSKYFLLPGGFAYVVPPAGR